MSVSCAGLVDSVSTLTSLSVCDWCVSSDSVDTAAAVGVVVPVVDGLCCSVFESSLSSISSVFMASDAAAG